MAPGRLALLITIAWIFCFLIGGTLGMMTICSQGCGYDKIQAAIDAAGTGDTIDVHTGTYHEELKIGKQIVLNGIDTGDGKPALFMDNGTAVRLYADDATILGFDFLSCKEDGSALRIESSESKIYLNSFAGPESIITKGVEFWNSSQELNYQFNGRVLRGYLGNYWSDYTGKDENGDGIGDEPVYIDPENVDLYPLMQPAENYIIAGQKETEEQTINTRLKEPFVISIKTDPKSTYKWFVDYDYHTLNLTNESYAASSIGSGGMEVWTFTPVKVKSSKIYFVCRRPWDNIVSDTRSFLILVSR